MTQIKVVFLNVFPLHKNMRLVLLSQCTALVLSSYDFKSQLRACQDA